MVFPRMVLILLILASPAAAARGKIILSSGATLMGDVRRDPDGSVWFSDRCGSVRFEPAEIRRCTILSRKDPVNETFMSSLRITPHDAVRPVQRHTPYDTVINTAARRHRVDPALVKAVMRAESNFNPRDQSDKGACGLMQLMPRTAQLLGVRDIFSPDENIAAGTRFLSEMMVQFDGNIDKALAAYNAGPSVVRRYNRVPPYRETQDYVRRVARYYREYRSEQGRIISFVDRSGCLTLYNVR